LAASAGAAAVTRTARPRMIAMEQRVIGCSSLVVNG
jgi:hypothetical protein